MLRAHTITRADMANPPHLSLLFLSLSLSLSRTMPQGLLWLTHPPTHSYMHALLIPTHTHHIRCTHCVFSFLSLSLSLSLCQGLWLTTHISLSLSLSHTHTHTHTTYTCHYKHIHKPPPSPPHMHRWRI